MFRRNLFFVAFVLATSALAAQTTGPAPTTKPAIMHERMLTLSGCLQRNPDWVLTGATLAGQKEAATYRLDGIGEARLLVLVDKKVEATGAIVDPKPASGAVPSAGKSTAAAAGQHLPRFEATALREVAATCS
jgi:hypothetical protein